VRIDSLILRTTGAALLLLCLVVVLADPSDVVDLSPDQLLLGDRGLLVRLVAGTTGALVVLSAATVGRALDPEEGRRAVPVLLGGAGLALVALAVTSPTEILGDAGGDGVVLALEPSGSAAANALALLVVTTFLPAAMILQAARWRRSDATAAASRATFVAAVVSLWASLAHSLAEDGTLPAPGLWQRVALVVAWAWLAVLVLRLAGRATSGSAGTRR
jgi:hypothetical protein